MACGIEHERIDFQFLDLWICLHQPGERNNDVDKAVDVAGGLAPRSMQDLRRVESQSARP